LSSRGIAPFLDNRGESARNGSQPIVEGSTAAGDEGAGRCRGDVTGYRRAPEADRTSAHPMQTERFHNRGNGGHGCGGVAVREELRELEAKLEALRSDIAEAKPSAFHNCSG
jgi:hypothetical protein